jgi:DNA polymerase (family 10)
MPPLKQLTNLQIAELLRNVADAYQFKNNKRNFFKVVAYQRAADAVEHATSELKDLWDDGKLEDIPGIGPNIAGHLDELFRTGKSKHFEEVMKGIPQKAFKLTELPGVGIKTALRLITQGKPGEVNKLLKEVEEKEKRSKRLLLPHAAVIAGEIIEWLGSNKKVLRSDTLGSLRRKAATIGDIDILVSTKDPTIVIDHFVKYPKNQKTIEKGDKTASLLLPGDVQVDLLVTQPETYGAALQHFTGSKHHNIALREYALKKGLSLSEYGIKVLNAKKGSAKLKTFDTEEKFYNHLGLNYIEPELREDTGEIEASLNHKLPKLVEPKDIRCDLQIHSSFDIETSHDLGESSMEEIIRKASEMKYEYLAFTEHNPSRSKHTENQIIEILKKKQEKIEQINYSIRNMNTKFIHGYSTSLSQGYEGVKKVFNSLEIDILPDGGLPVPDEGLNLLDFALISIHSSFDLDRDSMTKRILTALAHPKVKIFAHPTARKLNEREGVEINWPEIFDFCLKNNKWIEINADPMRLDLPDTLVHEAVRLGVKLTLGTDAHHELGLNNMIFGVSVARRGWCEADDIINTRSLEEFEKLLKR